MSISSPVQQPELRQLFSKVHQSNEATDDDYFDNVLGLNRKRVESGLSLGKLLVAHGNHRVDLGDSPYSVVRDVYRAFALSDGTPIVDLGAGYGRIGFYGAILWEQPVYGIEIVPERVQEARRVQQNLRLSSLHFEMGDLLTCAWPEGSHYLLLNSVLPSLMPRVIERLKEIAKGRRIIVASVSSSNNALRGESWLQERIPEVVSAELPASLRIFESR